MINREMLECGFETMKELGDKEVSRLEFLSDHIFEFTTYDTEVSELFARKALEVCAAISDERTFEYIKDPDNYRWFLLMVNMPFFAGRLDWGTSIRGAWWSHDDTTLESNGIWREGKQLRAIKLTRNDWLSFVATLLEFAGASVTPTAAAPSPQP